jgi:hypothetical protein
MQRLGFSNGKKQEKIHEEGKTVHCVGLSTYSMSWQARDRE